MPFEVLQTCKRSSTGTTDMRPGLIRLRGWKGCGSSVGTVTQRLCVGTTWVSVSQSAQSLQGKLQSPSLKKNRTGTIPTGTVCRALLSILRIADRSAHFWVLECRCIRHHGSQISILVITLLGWTSLLLSNMDTEFLGSNSIQNVQVAYKSNSYPRFVAMRLIARRGNRFRGPAK